MARDFISQASFEDGSLTLPRDVLGHEDLADDLLEWTRRLPAGSVIAVQGGWGRGKTDVLARLARKTMADAPPPGVAAPAIWINPWQYGSPDLLTPLVLALKLRAEQRGVHSETLARAASTVVQAGVSFGLKAAGSALPGAQLLGLVAPEAGRLAGGLVGQQLQDTAPGGDPVASLGGALRELTQAVVPPEVQAVGGRLIVCVDDLDRCLPDRQVALLQALRFGLSAGAPITFVVALDPKLARQGVLAHYGGGFEPDSYLDKMFDVRLNLRGMDAATTRRLYAALLDEPVVDGTRERPLAELLPPALAHVDAGAALPVPELRNPRLLQRVVRKLSWLAGRLPPVQVQDQLLLYLALGERWPLLRSALQQGPDFNRRLVAVAARYVDHHGLSGDGSAAVEALPTRGQAPGLSQVFGALADRIARDELPWALCEALLERERI